MDDWLDLEEAAAWLRVPLAEVRAASARGELPALRIGAAVRISRAALLAQADGRAGIPLPSTESAGISGEPGPAVDEPVWQQPLELLEDQDVLTFTYTWPDKIVVPFANVWEGVVTYLGARLAVRVAETLPRSDGSGRQIVFVSGVPYVEFAPTADGRGWASLIKPNGRSTLRPGQPLPATYHGANVQPYWEATGLSGQGRPNGLALVIAADDRLSAVRHALRRWAIKRQASAA